MDINISLYYLTIIIFIAITVSVYIINRLKSAPSMTNQLFIASMALDMLEDLENTLNKKDYATQLQNKIKEIAYKNNILKEIKQNIEKEKEIIEQKIYESTRDLREEHNRLLASINNLSFGFIMTDKTKNIILINKIIKTNIKLQENINLLQNIDEVLKTGKSLSVENIQINNKLVNIFISPVPAIGTVILIKDKTGERFIEQSGKNFITVASHELRTPLTAIKGYLSLIKELHYADIKDEKLKKIINDIDLSSTRLINIVNDFLDTSKLEQGKINFHPEESDLIYIINTSIKETESIATEKKLFINFDTPLENAKVFGDAERIKQIVINLISNAIKYTDQGGITISIEKTPDKYYKMIIKDTGKGISPENVKLLFSKFQQSDPNKPTNVVSTGLGLYISKLLTEKMNGKIKLDYTEKGKGSAFSFSLPIYEKTAVTKQTLDNPTF